MKVIINTPRTCEINPLFSDDEISVFELNHWFVCGDMFNLEIKCVDGELKDIINDFEISINYEDLKYLYANLNKELWKIVARNYPILQKDGEVEEKPELDNGDVIIKGREFDYALFCRPNTNKALIVVCPYFGTADKYPSSKAALDLLKDDFSITPDKYEVLVGMCSHTSFSDEDHDAWGMLYNDWVEGNVDDELPAARTMKVYEF